METDGGKKSMIAIVLLVVIFINNAFKFVEEGGSNFQITNILFNMILIFSNFFSLVL